MLQSDYNIRPFGQRGYGSYNARPKTSADAPMPGSQDLTKLNALSPLDGRYARSVDALRAHFSESALIRYRLRVELEWLKALAAEPAIVELKPFSARTVAALDKLVDKFSGKDAAAIKAIEARTNHDVKAI